MSETTETGRSANPIPRLMMLAGAVALTIIYWERTKPLVIFLVILGILVVIHELGHFLAARAVGVGVPEFAIGFGPRLCTWMRRKGTDFTIRMLPLGGFVNLKGMNPEEEDTPDGLNSRPPWARGLVFFAGPLANMILTVFILCSFGFLVGTMRHHVFVAEVRDNSPALHMGLQPGDRILSVGGKEVTDVGILFDEVDASVGQPLEVMVLRDQRTVLLTGTPKMQQLEDMDEPKVMLGFDMQLEMYAGARVGVGESVTEGLSMLKFYLISIARLFRSKNIGDQVGGPIRILQEVGAQADKGLLTHLLLMAVLSLSLAIFNLLPIPILDGGHLMLLTVEVLRRRRLEPATQNAVQFVGLVIIGLLFIFITFKDVRHWVASKNSPPSNAPAIIAPDQPPAPTISE